MEVALKHYQSIVNLTDKRGLRLICELKRNQESKSQTRDIKKKFLTTIKLIEKTATSLKTKEQVQAKIDVRRIKIGIKNVRNIKEGGIFIETETEKDLVKLIQHFKEQDDLKDHFNINKPRARKPHIICFDISADTEEKTLLDSMEQFSEGMNDFAIKHHYKSRRANSPFDTDNLNNSIENIQSEIKKKLSRTITSSNYSSPKKNAIWWTIKLQIKRSKTRALRSKFQKEQNPNIRAIHKATFKKALAEYKK
ncbi:hypothetical protein CEXT_318811 [Caerostris extrusa]|uniref:Uncharacterized protein n=1 Tax=Caerostris extrusa TaxID=172846 RepID=A0AAV4MIA0_CAEEX|nr:hypothetical protein CEXT_318811 [Caerostris extrusa]